MNCTLSKKSQAKKLETSRMMLLPVASFVTGNPDFLMDLLADLFIIRIAFFDSFLKIAFFAEVQSGCGPIGAAAR
jgi:hypothetical protein